MAGIQAMINETTGSYQGNPNLVVNGVNIGNFDCYTPSGTYGVLSLSDSSYEPAYPATRASDFGTALGSVNAYNPVRAWPGSHLH